MAIIDSDNSAREPPIVENLVNDFEHIPDSATPHKFSRVSLNAHVLKWRESPPRQLFIQLTIGKTKKLHAVFATLVITINSALGSSLPSGAVSDIAKEFSIPGSTQPVLLNSIYLVGFAIGPLIFGPLSEHLGRRIVLAGTFLGYFLFPLCCAVSPNFGALLFFRFLCGTAASAANAVIGPVYADIYHDPAERGKYMAYFMCTTSASPPFGPIISGYATQVSWRLSFWIGLGISGICLPLVLTMPETYAQVIKKRLRSRGHHVEAGVAEIPQTENKAIGKRAEIKILFTRPFTMLFQEPIVLFTSLYLALIYAVLYLFFQAYPIIFVGTFIWLCKEILYKLQDLPLSEFYGLSTGEMGFAFLPGKSTN